MTDIDTALEQDLRVRRAAVRRTELVLKVEQWAPGSADPADDWLRGVGELVDADAEEEAWLRQFVQTNGLPPQTGLGVEQWSDRRREQARQANAAASAAFLAGAYDTARDLIDDAFAHGGLLETEWVRLHQFIVATAAANADTAAERVRPAPPAQRAA